MRVDVATPTKLWRRRGPRSTYARIMWSAVQIFKRHFLARDAHDRSRVFSWRGPVNHEWARGVGHGITSDRGLGRRSPSDFHSLTKNTSLGHKDRDFLQLDTRAAALGNVGMQSSIVFLFAERNFRLCVNRNSDTIYDPVLPEPNRIFGLLNLSIACARFKPDHANDQNSVLVWSQMVIFLSRVVYNTRNTNLVYSMWLGPLRIT